MNTTKRGAFVVVEGVDRSGKSTQCRKLVESLKSQEIPAELMVFPDRTTKTGQLIDEYLKNKECKLNDYAIHLLFSANRWENVEKIRKTLFEGKTLIVDRYSYSGMVFSAAKDDMNLEWCKQPEVGLPKPDAVLLLTVSNEELQKRPGFGNERYENTKMQSKVSELYKKFTDETWKIVDAGGSLEDVHKVLLNHVLQVIEENQFKNLERLEFNDKIESNDMKEFNKNCKNEFNESNGFKENNGLSGNTFNAKENFLSASNMEPSRKLAKIS